MTVSTEPKSPGGSGTGRTWRVGTLVYDRRALINVFVWMLWGDFCLYLMDAGVGNTLVPLQLKKYGASNTMIALVNRSLIELLILVMCPLVSTWSDRHRGPRGRRIPFMLYATPPLAMFLTLLGFSPRIAIWLQTISPNLLGVLSAANLTIALITIMQVGYKLCDIFPQSVYYVLWADVIPMELMGTFSCLFRVVSTLGVFVFNKVLLRYCNDYPGPICAGAAGLYLVSFIALCLQVKEGGYPPPEPIPPGPLPSRALESVWRFCRESYTNPFYWKYYLFVLCFNVGFTPYRDFLILYGQSELKMNLTKYGNIMAARDLVQVAIYLVLGPIVDRLHPLRAGLFGYGLIFVTAACSYLFIHDANTFGIWVILTFAAVAIQQGATTALGPRLLPRAQLGQFCAASALVFHFGQMILTPVLGLLSDHYGNVVVFPWFAAFSAAGILCLYLVYREWKILGGDTAYKPPDTKRMGPGGIEPPT